MMRSPFHPPSTRLDSIPAPLRWSGDGRPFVNPKGSSVMAGSSGTRVCFVIPTYNEADNITLLLQRLTELYPDPIITFLVVDDESPDGTGRLVRDFAAGDGRVHLLEGKKRGLGVAYVRGITHALDALGAEVVVQMDADFSHDPADAGRLLAGVASDADVAIGSRYVAGGSIDQRWSWRRRQLSLWGNRLARWIAGLKGVRDCTAGFKAIRAAALRAAEVQEITVLGYAFQVALLHRLLHAGARVVEEPIHFREPRARGDQAGPGEPVGVRLPYLVAAPDQPSHLHQVLRDGGERGAGQPRLVPVA